MRIAFLVVTALFLPQISLVAQSTPAPPCEGTLASVRLSEIKPGGTLAGFMTAVAAHKAWYRSHGVEDNQVFATRLMMRDPQTREMKYSDNQLLTFHLNPPSGSKSPKHDESYDAFVKMYKDNSEIKSEYLTCLPKEYLK